MDAASLIVTFPSTHAAMKAERTLAEKKVPIVMIPVPRFITADCGIALRFPAEKRDEVEQALNRAAVDFKRIYEER
ncbi:MAG: DUF3343 domain-containing protein [Chloroflexi bacterium]|nr:DUF3343 domain-containing protein [Chloroflexota bacterium]